jgi:DNA repair exonuclease SbcCD nuclease subunit
MKKQVMEDNINGFPGYHITREGLLYSRYDNKGRLTPNTWKIRKPTVSTNGYIKYGFCLRFRKIKTQLYAHRLVAEAYIPNPNNYPIVMHLDDNPKNNSVENLKWGTTLDNIRDCIKKNRKVVRKQVISYVISDLHIGEYGKFTSRTETAFQVLIKLSKLCIKERVPLLHCGDLFHSSDKISLDLLSRVMEVFSRLSKKDFIILTISGNHGSPVIHRIGDREFISYDKAIVKAFPNLFYSLDYEHFRLNYHKHVVYGIPYIDNNIGLSEYIKSIKLNPKKKNILMLHTDYPGARDTDGREIDSVENLNVNVLNKFDLVLCGHIHKPQRLSKKVYMIGAPYQQRRTDKDCKLGYWKLYSDLSMEFVELKGFPKFIDVESEDEIKDDGNYYTILPKKTSTPVNNKHKITKQLSKKSLAKRYLREKGIKDEVKTNLLIETLKKAESC